MTVDTTILQSLQATLTQNLPSIGAALLILIIGWISAVLVRAALRRGLGMLNLNQRWAGDTEIRFDVERFLAGIGFWLVILIMLIGVFNALNLPLVSSPFETVAHDIAQYLPRLVGGTVLALIAWLVAGVLRALARRSLAKSRLDERLLGAAGMQPMAESLGNLLFWLVILLFLPAIIGAYQITGLLAPLSEMLSRALAALPNAFAALVIGFVGYLVARVLAGLSSNALAAAGFDKLGPSAGLDEKVKLSNFAGNVVMIVVFIPALIAALDALKIDTISRPASLMLEKMLGAVPQIIAAAMILGLTYFIARFAAQLLQQFLAGLGADALPEKLGLQNLLRGVALPSNLAATLLKFFAMLFATAEAADQLELYQVSEMVTVFIEFGGNVLLGSVIFMVGYWLSNLAHDAIAGGGSALLARIARLAIIGLVLSMGLRAMGIADDIVNMAFAFTFGAVAVVVSLAFGLGGREAAGKQMEYWFEEWRKRDTKRGADESQSKAGSEQSAKE